MISAAVGAFFYFKDTSSVKQETGTENREQEKKGTENKEQERIGTENSEQQIESKGRKDGVVQEGSRKDSVTTIDSVHAATPTVVEAPKPLVEETKSKQDTVSAVKEIPKKKLSFREKHTQNIKADSLRPLFVPVK